MGLGSPDKVPPLTEKAAMELGGEVLGDAIVLLIAAGLIVLEVARQSSNKNTKENALQQRVVDLENEVKAKLQQNQERIGELTKLFQDQIDDLNTKIAKLDDAKATKPTA